MKTSTAASNALSSFGSRSHLKVNLNETIYEADEDGEQTNKQGNVQHYDNYIWSPEYCFNKNNTYRRKSLDSKTYYKVSEKQ